MKDWSHLDSPRKVMELTSLELAEVFEFRTWPNILDTHPIDAIDATVLGEVLTRLKANPPGYRHGPVMKGPMGKT